MEGASQHQLPDCSAYDTQKIYARDFPGGAVVKNPPTKAGARVQALVQEDPTCRGATKPVRHDY